MLDIASRKNKVSIHLSFQAHYFLFLILQPYFQSSTPHGNKSLREAQMKDTGEEQLVFMTLSSIAEVLAMPWICLPNTDVAEMLTS